MLHKETLQPGTLELIHGLQRDPKLDGFLLVGGTALALMLGHRISVVIDLFTTEDFEASSMLEHLENEYGFSLQYMHHNTLKGLIGGVFVDLITHPYPMIGKPLVEEGVRMASKQDIAAMKINAISGNGTRAKDFMDVYFLLKEFSMGDIMKFYTEKYSERNAFHALKSITYFADMDESAWPQMLREKSLTPAQMKKALINKRKEHLSSN